MKLSFKEIGLIFGVSLIFLSSLFFGRLQDVSIVLLLVGILIAIIFYLTILFSEKNLKTKITWTIFVVCMGGVFLLVDNFLISISYRIYISGNRKLLTEVNDILITKPNGITVFNEEDDNVKFFTTDERYKIQNGMKKLGIYMISKNDDKVYYELWGFLDSRLGITYIIEEKNIPLKNYRRITEKWFY